ncbi:MAG: hypothetical protein ACTHOU_16760 [Aureliella sp.]
MRSHKRFGWLTMMALMLASAGCCCVQGMPGDCGTCGMGQLAACKSCSGGCGDVYVDEWISQPPRVDQCCAGDCRPVRSLLQALWGSRFVGGCDMCGGCQGGCDGGCGGQCGYSSAGGSGCTTCGGMVGEPLASGGCNCGGGGGQVFSDGDYVPQSMPQAVPQPAPQVAPEPAPQVRYAPSQRGPHVAGQPRLVPGSYKVSAPRRLNESFASERINPARQKIDAKRAVYSQ